MGVFKQRVGFCIPLLQLEVRFHNCDISILVECYWSLAIVFSSVYDFWLSAPLGYKDLSQISVRYFHGLQFAYLLQPVEYERGSDSVVGSLPSVGILIF